LLIDLYRGVFGDKPEPLNDAIKTWPGSCGLAAWNAIPHIQRLIAAGREAGIPVVHVTGLDPLDSGIERWGSEARTTSGMTEEELDRRRRQFDIIDELAPLPGEAVIRKTGQSGFWCTPLAAHLYSMRVDSLIVGGESTSGCVRASVIEAKAYHFNVIVAEECVFDRHEAPHAINLFDMNQKYASVVPVAEALSMIATPLMV
jgi:nicotinamidase-related amidase